jgi:Xaa-Pro aminopeptidase
VRSNRLKRVEALLEKESANWILLTDSISVEYLTGFTSSNCSILYSSSKKILFTDFRYAEAAIEVCKDSIWEFVEISGGGDREIAQAIKVGQKVLFQSNYLTVDRFNSLKKRLSGVKLTPSGEDIDLIFSVKTADEIESLKKAAKIADISYKKFIEELSVGTSEKTAADRLDSICKEGGSSKPSFSTIVLFGERSSLPHGVPSSSVILKSGDTILVDFGATVDGFGSDMTRVAIVGEPTDKQKTLYFTVLEAQKLGKKSVKAGVNVKEIDRFVRDYLKERGYEDEFGHGTGHGVGLRIHETPSISKKSDIVLEAGMVVTIEPGLYLPNFGGVRIEDLLLVTETGYEELSNASHQYYTV